MAPISGRPMHRLVLQDGRRGLCWQQAQKATPPRVPAAQKSGAARTLNPAAAAEIAARQGGQASLVECRLAPSPVDEVGAAVLRVGS